MISTVPSANGWEVEVVGDNMNGYKASPIEPNLEHAYVYLMEYKLGERHELRFDMDKAGESLNTFTFRGVSQRERRIMKAVQTILNISIYETRILFRSAFFRIFLDSDLVLIVFFNMGIFSLRFFTLYVQGHTIFDTLP